MPEIREYLSDNGSSPFGQWFEALGPQAAAIVTVALGRLGDGNTSNVKPIGDGAAELRIDRGPGYRVYFGGTASSWSSCWAAAQSEGSRATLRRHSRTGASTKPASGPDGIDDMPLTRSFRETVQARASRDPA